MHNLIAGITFDAGDRTAVGEEIYTTGSTFLIIISINPVGIKKVLVIHFSII